MLCIFCPNPRTNKRGEHVWDNWLNKEDGRAIKSLSTVSYYGTGGKFIRSHPSVGLHVTLPVVCDACNNHWMSQVSTLAKERLEPLIRRGVPGQFNEEDLTVITALAFLKSAVLDWSHTDGGRIPCISRRSCLAFRASLVDANTGPLGFPSGLQVWIAKYQRKHKFEGWALTDEMTGKVGNFKGYRILVITYVVGSFIFQLTYPRWTKVTRNRPTAPFFQFPGDLHSVPIWPEVARADWPPFDPVSHSTLEAFSERLKTVRVPS